MCSSTESVRKAFSSCHVQCTGERCRLKLLASEYCKCPPTGTKDTLLQCTACVCVCCFSIAAADSSQALVHHHFASEEADEAQVHSFFRSDLSRLYVYVTCVSEAKNARTSSSKVNPTDPI